MTVQAEVLTIENRPRALSPDFCRCETQFFYKSVTVDMVHEIHSDVLSDKQVVDKNRPYLFLLRHHKLGNCISYLVKLCNLVYHKSNNALASCNWICPLYMRPDPLVHRS